MVALSAPGNVTGAEMRAAQAVTSMGQKSKSHRGQADGSQPGGSEGAGHTQARFYLPREKLPCQLVKKSKGDTSGKYSPTLRQVLPRVEHLEGNRGQQPCPWAPTRAVAERVLAPENGGRRQELRPAPAPAASLYLIFALRVHQACL